MVEPSRIDGEVRLVPEAVPEILGHDPKAGLFAMAWLDPAFDVVFCLNHLLLKCLAVPPIVSIEDPALPPRSAFAWGRR